MLVEGYFVDQKLCRTATIVSSLFTISWIKCGSTSKLHEIINRPPRKKVASISDGMTSIFFGFNDCDFAILEVCLFQFNMYLLVLYLFRKCCMILNQWMTFHFIESYFNWFHICIYFASFNYFFWVVSWSLIFWRKITYYSLKEIVSFITSLGYSSSHTTVSSNWLQNLARLCATLSLSSHKRKHTSYNKMYSWLGYL